MLPFGIDSISTPRSLLSRTVPSLFHVMVAWARAVHVKWAMSSCLV